MSGERDGGKTAISRMMLKIHGNFRDKNCSNYIYSLSAGEMGTQAKFGKGASQTTYPIEIAEYGTIEKYGRNEDLVETIKQAIEGLIIRRGKSGSRFDAPFPSCSSLIINGNSFISKKGEILKRLYISKFSQDDRHQVDDPRTQEFNKLQDEESHKLKIL
jgi:hypothetical protein